MIKTTTIILVWFALAGLLAACSNNPVTQTLATNSATVAPTPIVVTATPTSAPIAISFELISIIKGDPQPLNVPVGIAVDKQGNLYVMDTGNSRVVKFDSDGKLLTTWGTRGESDGQFNVNCHGCGRIAVDGQGNVYVADSSSRIQKFDGNGKFLAKWGSKGEGNGQFSYRLGVAVDSEVNVYTAEADNDRIEKFNSNGDFVLKWGGKGTGDAEIFGGSGVSTDKDGNVYVTELLNGRIQKFDSNGKPLAKFFIEQIKDKSVSPADIAVDSQSNLYVTDFANNRVVKLDNSGKLIAVWGSPGTGNSQFDEPWGVAVDAKGNVYVVDSVNGRVQKFRQK